MSHIPFTSAEHKAQEYRRNEMCALNHNHKTVGLQMYYNCLFGVVLEDLFMTSDKEIHIWSNLANTLISWNDIGIEIRLSC